MDLSARGSHYSMIEITEQDNPASSAIDEMPTLEALRVINAEDTSVAHAVEKALPDIAYVIDQVTARLKNGGRLFYIGTGTSGRLGVLDASELPPTFGVSQTLVTGVIAGGYEALVRAVEASEDDREAGAADLLKKGLTNKDAVVGIAASGRTPYTIGAVEYARSIGCFTACITCNPESPITNSVDRSIVAVVGPEVITGSTRMKSGTAQKLILNMISTMVMVKLGYVHGNRMVNVRASNQKLIERSLRLLVEETGLSKTDSEELMAAAKGDLKVAIVMNKADVSYERAVGALDATSNVIDNALSLLAGK